jgi:hypothetical protein
MINKMVMNSSGRIFDVHAAQNAFHFFSVISLLAIFLRFAINP